MKKHLPDLIAALVLAFVLSGGLNALHLGPPPEPGIDLHTADPGIAIEPPLPRPASHRVRPSAHERFTPIRLQCFDHTWRRNGRIVARQTRC